MVNRFVSVELIASRKEILCVGQTSSVDTSQENGIPKPAPDITCSANFMVSD